ncbi:MAG: alkaline phosphatase [Candidatus Cyclobacteriaceae bacterium M3_2C_046]
MKKFILSVFVVGLVILNNSCTESNSAQTATTESVAKPKNIILMIGDGMGFAQVTAGMVSESTRGLHMEKMPFTGFSKTRSSDNLITDSAAGATALATGNKTYNGAIGVDSLKNKLTTILEIAEEQGLSTGVVATSSITHATPASFYAHQESRKWDEAIALDLVNSSVDLFMGGGRKFFEQREDGQDLTRQLQENGFTLLNTVDEAARVSTDKIGYFIAEEQPMSYVSGRGNFLPEATSAAIDHLNKDEDGFFLMVEGSQIDWGGHANDLKYVITELLDFDRAVGRALKFAAEDENTLVIVTADHETGGFAVTDGSYQDQLVLGNFVTKGHSGSMVPVFAYGPGAELFTGMYENTELFYKMLNAWQQENIN